VHATGFRGVTLRNPDSFVGALPLQTVAVARNAMATRFEVLLHGANPVALRAAAEEALDEIERLEAQLSLYRPTSEISRINARAATEPVRVEPELFRLLQQAQHLSRESDGAFDITVAPLVRCWGFMGGTGALPDEEAIAMARDKVGMHQVTLNDRDFTVRFAREGMMLDLGSIGKGYALERAVAILQEAGVEHALLHGGTSTVCALGAPPDAEAWKVAIHDPTTSPTQKTFLKGTDNLQRLDGNSCHEPLNIPLNLPSGTFSPSGGEGWDEGVRFMETADPPRNESPPVLAVVSLKNEAMSVSGVHGKFFSAEGKAYGHVLDPRSGRPVQGPLLAAVVLPSATETDALSTALLTLGSDGHERIARLRPGMKTWLLTRDERTGEQRLESKGT
jgi:thiamine biosynthesis lipoprotein